MIDLVSVVINNYNYGRFVRQAIESALAQSYGNIEVIVVDDGSTDDSPSIILDYANRATVILKENGGQATAFNAGITAAKGRYILLLDSDDYLLPDAIEICVRNFPEGYSRVFFRLQVVDDLGAPIEKKGAQVPFLILDGSALECAADGRGFPATPTSGNLFLAAHLKAVLPIPPAEYRICADAFLFVRTAVKGRVRSIDRTLGVYRVHGKNAFSPQAQLLLNSNRLLLHIDNYFKTARLIERAAAEVGIPYKARPMEREFGPLQLLCAGHKQGIPSVHLRNMSTAELSRRVCRYLAIGIDPIVKRVPRAIYLLAVLWMPKRVAEFLLRTMDRWRRR